MKSSNQIPYAALISAVSEAAEGIFVSVSESDGCFRPISRTETVRKSRKSAMHWGTIAYLSAFFFGIAFWILFFWWLF